MEASCGLLQCKHFLSYAYSELTLYRYDGHETVLSLYQKKSRNILARQYIYIKTVKGSLIYMSFFIDRYKS